MARKISFINYKGGVGKTSLIVNTAASLAQVGKRVLVVDLDVQSNSSLWLLRLERWNPMVESKKGYLYNIFESSEVHLRDCIVRDVVRDGKGAHTALPGLDLLPTTFSLIDLDERYEAETDRPPYVIFQEQLAEIEGDYDFILFDCPPNILAASSCGIFSSNEIYVPSNPDALSLIGFTLLAEKLEIFYRESARFRTPRMGAVAQIRGIIFNAIKSNVNISSAKMRLEVRMIQLKGRGVVSRDVRILNSRVRDEVVVPRAVTLGLPVCLVGSPGQKNTVRDDYEAVAQEILDMAIKPAKSAPVDSETPKLSAMRPAG